MFKTIKLPIQVNPEDSLFIKDIQRQYSLVVRYAYNRFIDEKTEKEMRVLIKSLNNIDDLNSWLVQCAILDAKEIYNRNNKTSNKQILFGGKGLLKRLHKGLITKQEFKDKRLRPIQITGERLPKGNRMFDLKIQDENKVIFKINFCDKTKNKHIEIKLPKLRNNWLNQLWKMEFLVNDRQLTYSIKLTSTHIYISFDDKDVIYHRHLDNRCLGIDMNPNFIGISVLEFDNQNNFKILETKMFDIQKLTVKSKKSISDKKSIYLHNKLQYETIEITKSILNLCKAWNLKFVYFEDLNFKGQANNGNEFNRLTKNKWLKTLFQEQLKKRLDMFGFKYFNINPMYTSVIGNLQYDYPDPINASIEIARRGQDVIINKTKKFYPDVWIKEIFSEQWKQTQDNSPKIWTEVFKWLKNSKLKYRVSLNEYKRLFKVFSQNSIKSKVELYCFT